MTNVLSDEKKNQIVALGGLGWPLRRIEEETGVRRETAGAYLRAAGVAVRGRGRPEQRRASEPAISGETSTDSESKPATTEEVSTDSNSKPAISVKGVSTDSGAPEKPDSGPRMPGRAPNGSACEPFRELIEEALRRGRNAMAIYQDLVDDHGFQARYSSVKRFVQGLRGSARVEARVIITTATQRRLSHPKRDNECAERGIMGRVRSWSRQRALASVRNPKSVWDLTARCFHAPQNAGAGRSHGRWNPDHRYAGL